MGDILFPYAISVILAFCVFPRLIF